MLVEMSKVYCPTDLWVDINVDDVRRPSIVPHCGRARAPERRRERQVALDQRAGQLGRRRKDAKHGAAAAEPAEAGRVRGCGEEEEKEEEQDEEEEEEDEEEEEQIGKC